MTSFKYKGGYYSAIMTYNPIPFSDYNIQITAMKIANILIDEMSDAALHISNQLKDAKYGTDVLLSIGIDNLDDFNSIAKYIGKLAEKYKNLNFYVFSLVGVDQNLCEILNTSIKEYNRDLKNQIEIFELSNLKYKSILYDENPTLIFVDNRVVDILEYTSEGSGFSKEGYAYIFKAMVEGLWIIES